MSTADTSDHRTRQTCGFFHCTFVMYSCMPPPRPLQPKRTRQRCLTCRGASPGPDHSLAHAACPCYDQDDEFQYNGGDRGDAQRAELWTAVSPTRRRLNYLMPNPSPDRRISLSVQKYMHRTNGMQCTTPLRFVNAPP